MLLAPMQIDDLSDKFACKVGLHTQMPLEDVLSFENHIEYKALNDEVGSSSSVKTSAKQSTLAIEVMWPQLLSSVNLELGSHYVIGLVITQSGILKGQDDWSALSMI